MILTSIALAIGRTAVGVMLGGECVVVVVVVVVVVLKSSSFVQFVTHEPNSTAIATTITVVSKNTPTVAITFTRKRHRPSLVYSLAHLSEAPLLVDEVFKTPPL